MVMRTKSSCVMRSNLKIVIWMEGIRNWEWSILVILQLQFYRIEFWNCRFNFFFFYKKKTSKFHVGTGGGADAPYGRRTCGTFQSWKSGWIHHAWTCQGKVEILALIYSWIEENVDAYLFFFLVSKTLIFHYACNITNRNWPQKCLRAMKEYKSTHDHAHYVDKTKSQNHTSIC